MGALVKSVVQITFLWLIFLSGNALVSLLKLPLPGNVAGMLILFGLLTLKVVPISWIEEGAGILLKHLAFFFIPIAVGLMAWGDLFSVNGLWLTLILVFSAVISISVTGWLVQLLRHRGQGN